MGTFWIISVIIAVLIGIICYLSAKGNNKNPQKAFIGGFIISLLVALGLSFLKKKIDQKSN